MEYFVSAKAVHTGNGTKQSPFKTIQEAAEIAKPGLLWHRGFTERK